MEQIQKTLTLKDIKPYSERWENIKREVSRRFNSDFNFIQFENRKINEYWFERVVYPETKETDEFKEILGYLKADLKEDYSSKEATQETRDKTEELENEAEEKAQERIQEEINEVIWGTIFEAKDKFLAEKLKDNATKLYNMGLTIIDFSDNEGEYNTGVFIGCRGAGFDFYEQYWIPLYCNVLEWVNPNDFKGKTEK